MLFLRFAKRTRISDLAVGSTAVIEGQVQYDGAIKVPGTDHDGVYHETVLEEWKTGTRQGRPMWQVVSSDEELAPFWVDDGAGRVYVLPIEGRVEVKGGRDERGAGKRRGTRYVTRYIASGDLVRVRGVVAQPKPGKKGNVRPGLEIRSPEGGPLVILFRKTAASNR